MDRDDLDDLNHIPLKNLPASGLIVWTYDKWKKGDPVSPNNVLIACIDNLDKVSLVGRCVEDGSPLYASSTSNIDEIIEDLEEFIDYLKEYR